MDHRPDICVIVPSIREYECIRSYAENARTHGFDLDRLFVVFVTESFCETAGMRRLLETESIRGAVFDGPERARWFERNGIAEYADLIPDSSHAQTSFGLLYLWENDHFEYGIFIDDDTRPHDDIDFFGTHLSNLSADGEFASYRSDEQWVNVLHHGDHDLYPRGYPYSAMDESLEVGTEAVDEVVASQGLWTNVPDLDAVRILMDGDLNGQASTRTTPADFREDFVVAPGNYLTICSMNLAFHREVIPAFYQFPMDDNEWGVGRFDDIWSGVVLKRACDVMGTHILSGSPLCEHNKAQRSTFADLENEVAGLELNEHFWRIVDGIGSAANSYTSVSRAIANELESNDWSDWINGDFLNHCGEYLHRWIDCLDAIEARPATPSAIASDD